MVEGVLPTTPSYIAAHHPETHPSTQQQHTPAHQTTTLQRLKKCIQTSLNTYPPSNPLLPDRPLRKLQSARARHPPPSTRKHPNPTTEQTKKQTQSPHRTKSPCTPEQRNQRAPADRKPQQTKKKGNKKALADQKAPADLPKRHKKAPADQTPQQTTPPVHLLATRNVVAGAVVRGNACNFRLLIFGGSGHQNSTPIRPRARACSTTRVNIYSILG